MGRRARRQKKLKTTPKIFSVKPKLNSREKKLKLLERIESDLGKPDLTEAQINALKTKLCNLEENLGIRHM